MPNVTCGQCGRRTMVVADSGETPCPRCGEVLRLRPIDRVIRVRRVVDPVGIAIKLAILPGVAAGGWWIYGRLREQLKPPEDEPETVTTRRAPPPLVPDTKRTPPPPPPTTTVGPPPPPPTTAGPIAPPAIGEETLDVARLRAASPVPVKIVPAEEFFARLDAVSRTTDADLERIRRVLASIGEPDEAEFAQRVRAAIRDVTPALYDPSDKTVYVREKFDPVARWVKSPALKEICRDVLLLRAAADAKLWTPDPPGDEDLAIARRAARESAATRQVAEQAAQGRAEELAQALIRELQLARNPKITLREAVEQAELQRAALAAASGAYLSGFAIARHFHPMSMPVEGAPLSAAQLIEAGRPRATVRFRLPALMMPGWKLVDEDTFGAHGLVELGRLSFGRVGVFHQGAWAGDRWALFEKDGRRALILLVVSRAPLFRPLFSGHPSSPAGECWGKASVNVFGLAGEEASTAALRALRHAVLLESSSLDEIADFLRRPDPPMHAEAEAKKLRTVVGVDLSWELYYACFAFPEKALEFLEEHVKNDAAFTALPPDIQKRIAGLMRELEPKAGARLKAVIARILNR